MQWVDSATHDQRLAALPNPIAYIWDETHPPQGPRGWDPVQYWPWELLGMCFGALSSFQVDFFAQYGILSFWLFFTPKTTHFWTHLDLEWHLDGA